MENEKRLIDANALQFEPDPWGGMNGVICVGRSGGKTMATVQAALKRMIDNAPTVDAVEVVRCKDCKHRTVTADGMVCECALPTKRMQDYYIYGSTILARVEPDAFCSHGEKAVIPDAKTL